ncbi:MAG: PH domain-containing protein [Verrucomicrobiota bacterium]|nr:PH domain-containing protein [Verrucomicrobiota bacterium]
MNLFLYLNGSRRGPFPEDQVEALLAEGLLQPADLASDGDDGALKPLSTFRDFRSTVPSPTHREPALVPEPAIFSTATSSRVPDGSLGLARESLGPYARGRLKPNETPYHQTNLHWIVFFRFALLALLVLFFLALPFAISIQALTGSQLGWFVLPLPAFLMLPPALAYASSEFVITDLRVLMKSGIVHGKTAEIFVSDVASIAIQQGFLARLCDYGTVTIRRTDGDEECLETIARSAEFRDWIQRMQSGKSSMVASAVSS